MSPANVSDNGGPAAPARPDERSVAARVERGRAARRATPRRSHAEWERPAGVDPVAITSAQEVGRLSELLPLRHERMLSSPLAFYRGAAAIMAADLAGSPDSGLTVQACGDAHLSNFGVFAAPDRRQVFDINDFDETHPGPWEWDLKRLTASLVIAGRDRGLSRSHRNAAAAAGVASYREEMAALAALRDIDVWYSRGDVDELLGKLRGQLSDEERARVHKRLDRASQKTSLRALGTLAVTDGDGSPPRLVSDPPLVVPIRELVSDERGETIAGELHELLAAYRGSLQPDLRHLMSAYEPVDMARKVVGVGSVGLRAWVILLMGRDDRDPLFLQAKEARSSVLEPYTGRGRYSNHGRRVVEGQRLMQAAGDILLGWVRVTGLDGEQRDFYVRQLWDGKGSVNLERMDHAGLELYARLCGGTLARAHARSGDRIAIAAYLGKSDTFDQALATFAETYADQNELDHAALKRAVEAGAPA